MVANKKDLIFPELSYRLVGILFKVHRELGGKYQEKYYQRAVEQLLKEDGLKYEREVKVDLIFNDTNIGKYYLDFLIDGKLILELKATPFLHPDDFKQVLAYLKSRRLKLGILANFRGPKLVYKRILNSEINL